MRWFRSFRAERQPETEPHPPSTNQRHPLLLGRRATSRSVGLCTICQLSVGSFMKHLATLRSGIWWLPWPYTNTHTTICPPFVIPMSSDNIHFRLLSANGINTNPPWRGPGSTGSLSTKWLLTHTHTGGTHTPSAPPAPPLPSPRRLDWGNVN